MMLGPLNISIENSGVSFTRGFLPEELPLRRLPDAYRAWELIVENLPVLLKTNNLRQQVDILPLLSSSNLSSEPEWQRAYLVLSFMAHGYIWGGDRPSERLPAKVAVPFSEAANHFDLPTTATYAGLNLWNWTCTSATDEISLENLSTLHTFTGSRDEEWFYLISIVIEARGAEVIRVMLQAIDAVRSDDYERVISSLLTFANVVEAISAILKRMHEHCDPQVFYHQIRPFLAGSKNMAVAGLPEGVFYEEGNGKGQWRQYSGGSNAQSSLIQFFDIVLGVEHSPTRSSKVAAVSSKSKHGFLQEMRRYMPGYHRDFLTYMEETANIRPYVLNSTSTEVRAAYDNAVAKLSAFRDVHIQIVTRYILTPSRMSKDPGKDTVGAGGGLNLAVASSNSKSTRGLHGTGGTELLPFLKQSRDETRATGLE